MKLIQDHLAPKPSEIVQRFKFNNRLRNEGESVADFSAAVRNLAEPCEHKDTPVIVLAPLHELLSKDCKWNWEKRQVEAFNQAKGMLDSSDLLVHFDHSKELVLSCNASPGLGAVLSSHIIDGKEKPISYASRTLASAEGNYAQ